MKGEVPTCEIAISKLNELHHTTVGFSGASERATDFDDVRGKAAQQKRTGMTAGAVIDEIFLASTLPQRANISFKRKGRYILNQ